MPLPIVGLLGLALNLAPTLAQWIGGDKAAGVTSQIADAAKGLIGTDDPDALAKAIAADPNLALQFKLRLADIEDAERQRSHAELIARMADTQSARDQTVKLAQAGSPLQWGAAIVSVIVTGAFGLVTYLVFSEAIPSGNREMALYLIGQLSGFVGAAVSYWVGSSAGSASKDLAIKKMLG